MTRTWHGSPAAAAAGTARRDLLRLAAAGAATVALTGCTASGSRSGDRGQQAPSVDDLARTAAATDALALADLERQAQVADPALAPVLLHCVTDHEAHLAALGTPTSSATGSAATSTTAPPAATATTATAPPVATATAAGTPAPTGRLAPKALVAAEWAAAGRALAASAGVGPAMAVLLVRIAASRAVHADLLSRRARLPEPGALQPATVTGTAAATGAPSGTTTDAVTGTAPVTPATAAPTGTVAGSSPASSGVARSQGSRQALADLLSGEHAAVYAYGVLAARAAPAQRPLAQDLWQQHLADRDLLESLIVADGDTAPVPAAGYDLGTPPSTPEQVVALAARVERGLASVAASAVAGAGPDIRRTAADHLVAAARRAARWGIADQLPGTPAPTAPATSGAPGPS